MTTGLDTPIRDAMLSLVFDQRDDYYKPEYARYVVEAIGALDDESAAVTIRLMTMNAVVDLN